MRDARSSPDSSQGEQLRHTAEAGPLDDETVQSNPAGRESQTGWNLNPRLPRLIHSTAAPASEFETIMSRN